MYKFIDHENWVKNQPTLKSIFDNLRNYPLLAIYFAVTWSAIHKVNSISLVLCGFMLFILAVLVFLSLMQTSMLVSAVFIHAFFPEIKKANKISLIFGVIFTFLFAYAMFLSLGIFTFDLVSTYVAR